MMREKSQWKIELWKLLEKNVNRLSDDIGWGSMDSLCEDIKKWADELKENADLKKQLEEKDKIIDELMKAGVDLGLEIAELKAKIGQMKLGRGY